MSKSHQLIEKGKLFKKFYRIQNDIKVIIPIDKNLSEYYLKPIILLEEFETNLKKRFDDFTDDMSIEDIIRLKFGDDMVSRFLSVL